jgi:hypothetical protein
MRKSSNGDYRARDAEAEAMRFDAPEFRLDNRPFDSVASSDRSSARRKLDMKRTLSLAVALLIAGGLSAPAFAQANHPVIITSEMSTANLPMDELSAFGQLAAANPKMARGLSANPRLANSKSFLKRNPALGAFFTKYPGSKERFEENPGNYLPGVRMFHGRVVTWHHRSKPMAKKPAAAAASESEEKKSEAAPAEPSKPEMPPSEPKTAP